MRILYTDWIYGKALQEPALLFLSNDTQIKDVLPL